MSEYSRLFGLVILLKEVERLREHLSSAARLAARLLGDRSVHHRPVALLVLTLHTLCNRHEGVSERVRRLKEQCAPPRVRSSDTRGKGYQPNTMGQKA